MAGDGLTNPLFGSAMLTDLTLGSGTGVATLKGIKKFSLTLSPTAILAGAAGEQTFSCPGLATSDWVVTVCKPTAQAGLGIVGYRVTGNDTLGITFMNTTLGSILPTGGQSYTVIALSL